MRHDELLAKIVKWYDYAYGSIGQVHGEFCISSDKCECWKYDSVTDGIYKALRAVVELHKPKQLDDGEPKCMACETTDWYRVYPCPTIQAIEEQLK